MLPLHASRARARTRRRARARYGEPNFHYNAAAVAAVITTVIINFTSRPTVPGAPFTQVVRPPGTSDQKLREFLLKSGDATHLFQAENAEVKEAWVTAIDAKIAAAVVGTYITPFTVCSAFFVCFVSVLSVFLSIPRHTVVHEVFVEFTAHML